MTNISTREATRADIKYIAEFQHAMALETENRTLDALTLKQGISAVFDAPQKGCYIVADVNADEESGAQVLGSLLITYEWSDWNNATYFWIQSVYVDSAWRRRGVYRALYEHVLSMAAKRGDNCGIRLYVERTNTIAQQAYNNLGMHKSPYDLYEKR